MRSKRSSKTGTRTARRAAGHRNPTAFPFPIVGIGASVGGLVACQELLQALPPDLGAAFVVVLHRDPMDSGAVTDVLAQSTCMPVHTVTHRMMVKANHVYVIPPGWNLSLAHGALLLSPLTELHGQHRTVDHFLRSLAQERQQRAIGVILSGPGMDGVVGLEAIKAAGGVTFAQDESARHTGMPLSAIVVGCVDAVLSPSAMASEIARLSRHPYVLRPPEYESHADAIQANLDLIIDLVRRATGIALGNYDRTSLYRSITRREMLHKLHGLKEYARLLEGEPAEVRALYRDMLGGVTHFFRNSAAFAELKARVLPRLLNGRSRLDPVRVWVVGCSTGAEAYSIAMAYAELMETTRQQIPLQLFATDLNEEAIEKARGGVYSEAAVRHVSVERRRRFFVEGTGMHRIAKRIREPMVFATHDLLSDPPFSKIDLVSCQNLLIYLTPAAQERAVATLSWALKPRGILWLGDSESIGRHGHLFEAMNSRHKFYVKKAGSMPHGDTPNLWPFSAGATDRVRPHGGIPLDTLQREADRVLAARYAPAAVLVNDTADILLFWGDTGPYLTPPTGEPRLNLLAMLREGLLTGVRGALVKATREGRPAREPGLRVETDGGARHVDVWVIPLKAHDAIDVHYLVLFEQAGASSLAGLPAPEQAPELGAEMDVSRQLAATQEYLQYVIEQQQAANVALQSSQSEIQSVNQELQSINEELLLSQEEIFASNQEVATAHADFQALRAHSLALFAHLLAGGDQAWTQELRRGLYSRWLREAIKDEQLAAEVAGIENDLSLSPEESRALIKAALERSNVRPTR